MQKNNGNNFVRHTNYTTFAGRMKNLARHIELLLRDNDCVILPDLGGFIAHDVPAYYVSEEGTYYPPSRSISFNAAIKMNDGLLAQSYMKSYQVDYARANYMIEMAVEEMLDTLDEEGAVTLARIGTLRQDVHQTLQFVPEASGVDSPMHFGLGALLIKTVAQMQQPAAQDSKPKAFVTHTKKTIDLHIDKGALRRVLSTAAVFLLLLMMALPTGTHQTTDIASLRITDIITTTAEASPNKVAEATLLGEDKPNGAEATDASFASAQEGLTDGIAEPVMLNEVKHLANDSSAIKQTKSIVPLRQGDECSAVYGAERRGYDTLTESNSELTEVAPNSELIIQNSELTEKTYHIIVASLPSRRGADETLSQYSAKGYAGATIIERDDRVRISLAQFADKNEANEYLKTLRQNLEFQNAWLLAVRN